MRVFIEFDFHRSPNKPEHIDDLRNRYRTIDWEAYDQSQKYLEIGENQFQKQHITNSVIFQSKHSYLICLLNV